MGQVSKKLVQIQFHKRWTGHFLKNYSGALIKTILCHFRLTKHTVEVPPIQAFSIAFQLTDVMCRQMMLVSWLIISQI